VHGYSDYCILEDINEIASSHKINICHTFECSEIRRNKLYHSLKKYPNYRRIFREQYLSLKERREKIFNDFDLLVEVLNTDVLLPSRIEIYNFLYEEAKNYRYNQSESINSQIRKLENKDYRLFSELYEILFTSSIFCYFDTEIRDEFGSEEFS